MAIIIKVGQGDLIGHYKLKQNIVITKDGQGDLIDHCNLKQNILKTQHVTVTYLVVYLFIYKDIVI